MKQNICKNCGTKYSSSLLKCPKCKCHLVKNKALLPLIIGALIFSLFIFLNNSDISNISKSLIYLTCSILGVGIIILLMKVIDNYYSFYSTLIMVLLIIISSIFFIYYLTKPSDYEIKKENEQNEIERQQREACRNKSNTYYKCSWSFIEDDCICKQR